MEQKKGLVIGITGQSGGGKTLVGSLLSKYGFPVIDADVVSRKVVEPGTPALRSLVATFGPQILQASGYLNRTELGKIAFSDKEKQADLQRIIFPYIMEEIHNQITMLQGRGVRCIFLDAPTLLESGSTVCDKIISVIAPKELRSRRILLRDNITPEQVEARLSAQQEDDYYITRSDFVIYNKAKPHALERQVLDMLVAFGLTIPPKE